MKGQVIDAGRVIDDRFAIEREVAAGGMGRVFLATDRLSGRPVAFKIVAFSDARAADRFDRECALLAEIRHPGIVGYVAHGMIQPGAPYLVMEWLEGEDLGQRLHGLAPATQRTVAGKPSAERAAGATRAAPGLSVADTIVLARRVASALAELHRRGIVHRDIKPGNLFLVDGQVARIKVLDFGAARATAAAGAITQQGVLVGTPYYMAPEQARGSDDIGPAADVWALGCVVYECLAGAAPFAGQHPLAALARIVIDEPAPVAQLRPDLPADVAALVDRMLAKQPAARPADGDALLTALDELDAPVSGAASTVRYELVPTAPHTTGARPRRARRPSPGMHAALGTSETRVAALVFARGAGSTESLRRAREVAHRHGAEVDALADQSRSVMIAITGVHAPTDQAARAARLALALRDALPDAPISIAMGRGQGPGSSIAPVARVVDHAVSSLLAARPGVILVDALTASLIDARFELAGAGEQRVLVAERAAEGARTLLGKPSRWVGRRRELAVLTATVEECAEDSVARAVLVTAPAGIGKSRLRYELVRAVARRPEPIEVLYGHGDSLSAGSPFVMIAPALRRSAGILDGEPVDARRAKLCERLRRAVADADLPRVAAFLGELIGVPFDDTDDPALHAARKDPMLLGDLMRGAWETWLAAECAAHPVLLVLEDLHWGDLPSVQYVDAALRALADRPFMVLALARPEVHTVFPTLWAQREVEEIRLHALSARACGELARAALGDRATDEVVDALVARSEGNAFYLEELVRAVAARDRLDALPDTVLGMVQARLDALDGDARRVLRAASVFGEVFWEGGVRALVGEPAGGFDVGEWLDDLTRREVVSARAESRIPDQREYKFRHALMRDGAYAMLTEEDRALGHRLAGEWLESAGEQDALVLAGHFERGGDASQAIRWYRRAAGQALEGNDLAAVIERAERAITCGATGATLGDLRGVQATAAYWQSHYADARRCGAEAMALLAPGDAAWFRAAGTALVSSARLGDYDTVDRLFDDVLRAPRQPGAEAAQLIGLARGAFQLIFAARFARADEILARIAELADAAPELDALTTAQVHHVQGVRAAHIGDVATFLHHLERAVDAFERAGDTRNVSLERTTVAWCYAELGELERAETLCRASLAYCERIGAQQAVTYARVNLGFILAYRDGALAEAREVLERAIAECRAVGNPRLEGWAHGHLAEVAFAAGDAADSEAHARAAVELLRVSPGLQAWVLGSRARALVALGRADEAVAAAREAMPILQRLGGLLQGESLPPLALADALDAAGDRAGARAAIEDARARLLRRAERLGRDDWRRSFLALRDNARTMQRHAELAGAP